MISRRGGWMKDGAIIQIEIDNKLWSLKTLQKKRNFDKVDGGWGPRLTLWLARAQWGSRLELQTKVREDFTITEKAPTS